MRGKDEEEEEEEADGGGGEEGEETWVEVEDAVGERVVLLRLRQNPQNPLKRINTIVT